MDSSRWLKTRPKLPSEENLVKYLKDLPSDKDHKQDVDELVRHFLAAGYYIWNQWRMAQLSGWSVADFEKWKRGYNFKAGELAELEAISVNVAVVGLGDPRVSMDFDPNEFSVGLKTADEAFGGASGSLASFSSLEDANQVVQSMGGVLDAREDADGIVDVLQGIPVNDPAAKEPEGDVEVIIVEEEKGGSPNHGVLVRKRKRDTGKSVDEIGTGEELTGKNAAGASEGARKSCTDGGTELSADVPDRVGDHPEMVKRMEMKISKFRDYVMNLSVHSDMMTSDLARAMARVARVPGEHQRMEGVSKMNLGLETLSALGVAIQNATRVFDMCVNDDQVFRDMKNALQRSVGDLEDASKRLVAARELLERRGAEITVLPEKLKVETAGRVELSKRLTQDVEEICAYRVLLRMAVAWTRRVAENLKEKMGQAKLLSTENDSLRQQLEVARKEAADLRAFAGQREEKLIKLDRMMLIIAAHSAGYEVPPEVIFTPNVYDKAAQAKAVEFCGRFKKK
ncbi:uncharacterized protein [Euphorbia lathyris]|uniref:uncharacterized protein n=1 Tax=Euphorbia lathyris TaxID=212925 RepID=UPI0033130E1F